MNRTATCILTMALACWAVTAMPGYGHQFPEHIQDRVKALQDQPKPAVKGTVINDTLTAADGRDPVRQGSFAKVHVVQLAPGDYQIDLQSGAFDAYLRLEDPQGQRLAEDDDGGGFPNSRLFYKIVTPGAYRLIATTFAGGATGAYTLSVQPRGPGMGAPRNPPVIMPGKRKFIRLPMDK